MTQTDVQTQDKKEETVAAEAPVTQATEDINWKKFREEREADRKARVEADQRAKQKEAEAAALKAAMDTLLNKPAHAPSQDYDSSQAEDDAIQKRVDAAIAAREKKMDEERRHREINDLPRVMNTTYKDFKEVCTAENLDYLEYHYPEIAKGFAYMPEGVEKWSSIYQAVKRFIPKDAKKDVKKMEDNAKKPTSMSVAGRTTSGDTPVVKLDEQRRMDNWKRMQKIMKGN